VSPVSFSYFEVVRVHERREPVADVGDFVLGQAKSTSIRTLWCYVRLGTALVAPATSPRRPDSDSYTVARNKAT